MVSGNTIRGSRIGAGSVGEAERGEPAPRSRVSYFCANGHETTPAFAQGSEIPEEWECTRCGLPANRDQHNPPARPRTVLYKTHLDYVKERRSTDEAKVILTEALAELRQRRADGEVIY